MALERFTEDHEYIRVDGDIGTVGITNHAQEQLGDVVFVEVPEVGRTVNQKEAIAVVESVKAASDIYAPVEGEIVEGNRALEADPGLVNRDPYGEGWLFKIKLSGPAENSRLLDAAGYKAKIGG